MDYLLKVLGRILVLPWLYGVVKLLQFQNWKKFSVESLLPLGEHSIKYLGPALILILAGNLLSSRRRQLKWKRDRKRLAGEWSDKYADGQDWSASTRFLTQGSEDQEYPSMRWTGGSGLLASLKAQRIDRSYRACLQSALGELTPRGTATHIRRALDVLASVCGESDYYKEDAPRPNNYLSFRTDNSGESFHFQSYGNPKIPALLDALRACYYLENNPGTVMGQISRDLESVHVELHRISRTSSVLWFDEHYCGFGYARWRNRQGMDLGCLFGPLSLIALASLSGFFFDVSNLIRHDLKQDWFHIDSKVLAQCGLSFLLIRSFLGVINEYVNEQYRGLY